MNNLPGFFANSQSIKNFEKIFLLDGHLKNKEISALQLGAWTGESSRWIIENVAHSLVDVDLFSEQEYEKSKHVNLLVQPKHMPLAEKQHFKNTKGLNVKKFKGSTKNFFAQNLENFDFIYIDASHTKEDVSLDAEESFKILKKGGVMALDDFMWNYGKDKDLVPHVAILEFLIKHYGEIEILLINSQVWIKKI